jgi:hypothetical protein
MGSLCLKRTSTNPHYHLLGIAKAATTHVTMSIFCFQLATASFFEGDADGGTGSVESPPQSDNDEQDTPPPAIHFHGPGSSKPKSKSKEKSKASKPKFGTIASLKQQEEEEDDSDDEEGQAFYAGGSLHSGQQVIGPSKFFE